MSLEPGEDVDDIQPQLCMIALRCSNAICEDLPCRQSEGYPIEPAALVFPTQLPPCQPTPVTIPIFSLCDSFARAAVALVYASSQVMIARFDIFSSDGIAALVNMISSRVLIRSVPDACERAAVASTGRKKLRILTNTHETPFERMRCNCTPQSGQPCIMYSRIASTSEAHRPTKLSL